MAHGHGGSFPSFDGVILRDTSGKLDESTGHPKRVVGTIHPLWGPSFNLTGNQNPYAGHADAGPVRRVKTGAYCLNVRTEPTAAAKSLGCFKDGVLLRLRPQAAQPADGITWVAVETPDGRAGWASAEFMER